MRRILTPSALGIFAVVAGLEAAPASAQQQPAVVYSQPAPAPAAANIVRTGDPRAVLPAFAPQGGIGTTPYLGNTRGLGAFSTNYSAPARPTTTITYPARRRGLFRRMFNR
jgi:hypothetical protein